MLVVSTYARSEYWSELHSRPEPCQSLLLVVLVHARSECWSELLARPATSDPASNLHYSIDHGLGKSDVCAICNIVQHVGPLVPEHIVFATGIHPQC